ncbi:MAG: FecR family protein [Candidatus Erginobacter occultus]|nr:FecR family protein [Candidatus Erginobacter occultus]
MRNSSTVAAILAGVCLALLIIPEAGAEEDYFIPVLPGSTSTSIIESYLTGPPAWGIVVDYNRLLRPGNVVRVPANLVNLEGKAYISNRYGETEVRLSGEDSWREVLPGLIIQRGDTLRTGPQSGIEITMENGDQARLRELTTVEFIPIREGEKTNLLRVIRGKVISIIEAAPHRDIRYRIQTPTAVSLVRGTLFRTKVDENSRTVFEVLEGMVNVQSGDEELDLENDFGVKL